MFDSFWVNLGICCEAKVWCSFFSLWISSSNINCWKDFSFPHWTADSLLNWGKQLNWGSHSDFHRLQLGSDRKGYLSNEVWLCSLTLFLLGEQSNRDTFSRPRILSFQYHKHKESSLYETATEQTTILYPGTSL